MRATIACVAALIFVLGISPTMAQATITVTVSRGDVFGGDFERIAKQAIIDRTEGTLPSQLGIRDITGNPTATDVDDLRLGKIKLLRFDSGNNTLKASCTNGQSCGKAIDLVAGQLGEDWAKAKGPSGKCSGQAGPFRVKFKCN